MKKAVVRPVELPPGRRVLVISDIHGNVALLQALLRKTGFSTQDILILLGDIMERSEQSLDALHYVMELTEKYTVHCICGNCDNLTTAFLEESAEIPEDFYVRWFARNGERCALVKMAHMAGVAIETPADYPAARRAIRARFSREAAFLRTLPQILLHDDYLFVHGGVPREDRLEELDAFSCMKNDDFLNQGFRFRRWVIVGHWPVALYQERIASANPILLYDRHIASIDGGCTLKLDGQLNALILPERPGGRFTYAACDPFPVFTALDLQEASRDPVNVRWHHNALEVLEPGEEFSKCRHVESGRIIDVLTDYLRYGERGKIYCEDSTDYRLGVYPGDRLRVVRETSRGVLAKKNGVTGWYFGRLV